MNGSLIRPPLGWFRVWVDGPHLAPLDRDEETLGCSRGCFAALGDVTSERRPVESRNDEVGGVGTATT